MVTELFDGRDVNRSESSKPTTESLMSILESGVGASDPRCEIVGPMADAATRGRFGRRRGVTHADLR